MGHWHGGAEEKFPSHDWRGRLRQVEHRENALETCVQIENVFPLEFLEADAYLWKEQSRIFRIATEMRG
jgi:hypothetical protein